RKAFDVDDRKSLRFGTALEVQRLLPGGVDVDEFALPYTNTNALSRFSRIRTQIVPDNCANDATAIPGLKKGYHMHTANGGEKTLVSWDRPQILYHFIGAGWRAGKSAEAGSCCEL